MAQQPRKRIWLRVPTNLQLGRRGFPNENPPKVMRRTSVRVSAQRAQMLPAPD